MKSICTITKRISLILLPSLPVLGITGLVLCNLLRKIHTREFSQYLKQNKLWLYVCLGFFLPLIIRNILLRHPQEILFTFLHLVILYILGLYSHVVPSDLKFLAIGMICIPFLLLGERYITSHSWQRITEGNGKITNWHYLLPEQTFSSNSSNLLRGNRYWHINTNEPMDISIQFETQLLQGLPNWYWQPEGNVDITQHNDNNHLFTRIKTVDNTSYAFRRYTSPSFIGQNTFKLELEMRSSNTFHLENCNVRLQIVGGDYLRSCLTGDISESWNTYSLELETPIEHTFTLIQTVFKHLETNYIDVKNIKIYQWVKGEWQELSPLRPAGIFFELQSIEDSFTTTTNSIIPHETWKNHHISIEHSASIKKGGLRIILHIEPLLKVKIRNFKISTSNPTMIPTTIAQPLPIRQKLFSPHPNLLAHTLILIMIFLLTTTHLDAWYKMTLTFTTIIAIIFTGSRIALGIGLLLLTFILFNMYHGYKNQKQNKIQLVAIIIMLVILTITSFLTMTGMIRFGSLDLESNISRFAIWKNIIQIGYDKAIWGISPQSLTSYTNTVFSKHEITHAHNFFLQMFIQYGFWGIISCVTLLSSLMLFCFTHKNFSVWYFILALLLINLVDFSFFYVGVMAILIIFINFYASFKSSR